MFSSPRALSVASHLSDEDKEGEEEDVPCHGQPMRIERGGRCLVPLKSTHPHHHRHHRPALSPSLPYSHRIIIQGYVHLEPREHELLGWEVAGAELVVGDQTPDQAQDQLHVPVLDVRVA